MLSKGVLLIIISMIVFGILNLIENIIHYNIGRAYSNNENANNGYVLNFPTKKDLIKIIIVMIIFGLAQGLITEYFMKD